MSNEARHDATSESFEELVNRIEESEAYDIEDARYEISEWIYSAMEAGGKKKTDLAQMLNTSRAYVTKLLQGNGNFTVETLVKISRALGYKFKPTFIPKAATKTLTSPPSSMRTGNGYGNLRLVEGSLNVGDVERVFSGWAEKQAS
ncbi:MAG: hypothetical protein QOD32_2305 [Pyrinomonadaceae bacterium]|jgi:transcriptional regulator with XRE-family HTH domain|nr:hypothetical protein [Pyrinomonadaceae bacterium]